MVFTEQESDTMRILSLRSIDHASQLHSASNPPQP